ncbi:MAG: FAD:protein FMN transferase [Sedimentisphaerales bacterium]|nr:FAD:protein FMN transferase [Sedimentisphaerales bacterium]
MNIFGRIIVILLCLSLIVALFISCAGKDRVEADSGNQIIMGTFAHVVAIAEDSSTAEKSVRAALEEIRKVDDLMSDYKSDSEISRANRDAFDKSVQVSESTYEVLQRSVEFSKMTDGAFDITVGPLVALFRKAKKSNTPPSEEQINQAKTKVGFEKLKLDSENRTVQFTEQGMLLDLGGIAKGYAIDKAIEAAQNCGAIGAMVDIGGDIRCFGLPPKNRDHWLIGLQDPNSAIEGISGGGLRLVLKATNEAVATSGDYQQFVIIEGKRYSHIMDRKTGTSTEGLSSVTIIADNATDADALATTVSVMGAEKGLALIEKLPNTEAILISPQPKYEIIKTSGAEKYIKSEGTEK